MLFTIYILYIYTNVDNQPSKPMFIISYDLITVRGTDSPGKTIRSMGLTDKAGFSGVVFKVGEVGCHLLTVTKTITNYR